MCACESVAGCEPDLVSVDGNWYGSAFGLRCEGSRELCFEIITLLIVPVDWMLCPCCLLFDAAGPVISVFETVGPAPGESGRRAGEFIGIFPARAFAKRLSANANADAAYEMDELRDMCLTLACATAFPAVALLSAIACAASAAAVLSAPTIPPTACTPGASFQDEYIR